VPHPFAQRKDRTERHVQTLNDIIQQAHDGSTVNQWYFYLAVSDYDLAPRPKPDGTRDQATKTPVPDSFKSPFIGQSLESLAEWLRDKPEEVNLETKFFAVLDKKAKDKKVVLVRIAGNQGQEIKPSCVLVDADESSLRLAGMESGTWGELVHAKGEYTPDF